MAASSYYFVQTISESLAVSGSDFSKLKLCFFQDEAKANLFSGNKV